MKISSKKYLLGIRHRNMVNTIFDDLHIRGRMEWSDKPTPFGNVIFVIEKEGKANRPVVDLRPLNKVAIPDAYPMPLQSEIIEALKGK